MVDKIPPTESFTQSRQRRLKDALSKQPFNKKLRILIWEMSPDKSPEVDDFRILEPGNLRQILKGNGDIVDMSDLEKTLRKIIVKIMKAQNVGNIEELRLPNILRIHEILGWPVRDFSFRCMSFNQFKICGSQGRKFYTLHWKMGEIFSMFWYLIHAIDQAFLCS